ncbi:MAG: FapA family protein [Candidatus Hydrogenedentota bacterium]
MADIEDEKDIPRENALKRHIAVDFRDNDLKGYIRIDASTFLQYRPSAEEIKAIINSKGIKYGIDESIFENVISKKIEEQWVEIAWGKPAVEGKDGYIDYKFRIDSETMPKVDEHGRVNLKELHKIENIVKDQLLAVHIPPVYGRTGISVKRLTIHPSRVADVKLLGGTNTYFSQDGNELYASCDGMVVIRKNRIEVDPVYIVSGDVGSATGNIHFVGSVIVQGSVLDGYIIKANEEIVINGAVGAANIESGKSVTIKGGFNGKEKGIITAEKVEVLFVNQGIVYSKEDCIVHDSIMHSEIYTGGFLKVEEGKGAIIGGKITATKGVVANVIGAEAYPRTVIECGLPYEAFARFMQLEKEFIKNRRSYIESDKNINILESQKKEGKLDEEKLKLYDALIALRKKSIGEILAIIIETRLLSFKINESYASVISAKKIYPGTEFYSPKNSIKISTEQSPFFIKIIDGAFVVGSG